MLFADIGVYYRKSKKGHTMRKGRRMSRIASNVKICPAQDPELIAKLRALAPYYYLRINPLAKKLLHEKLDEVLSQYNITVDSTQPAVG